MGRKLTGAACPSVTPGLAPGVSKSGWLEHQLTPGASPGITWRVDYAPNPWIQFGPPCPLAARSAVVARASRFLGSIGV